MSSLVASLDSALAAVGEDVIVRRVVGSGAAAQNIDVRCRASARALSSESLNGSVTQTVWDVTLSPTQIIAAQWPGGLPATINPMSDPRVPRATQDKLIFIDRDHRECAISSAKPIYVNGDLVRISLLVTG